LTRDEREIEKIAVDIGSLNKVASLMVDLIPKDKVDWEEDEPEGTMRLREVILIWVIDGLHVSSRSRLC
jgi:armadillo repeat-containing protein 8